MADIYEEEYFIDYDYFIALLCPNMEIEGAYNMSIENRTDHYIAECDNLSTLLDFYDYSSVSSKADKIYVPVIFGLAFITGLIGNGLVVYVILKSASLKCVTNLFLLNLALADLLLVGVCVPFTGLPFLIPSWPFGEVMCKLVNYLMIVTMATSILTMTAMTIDRYFAVVKPLQSKSIRTPQRTTIILAVIWVTNFVGLLPLLQFYETRSFMENGDSRDYCMEIFQTPASRKTYYFTIAVIFYLLPLSVIAIAYGLMARKLWGGVRPAFKQVNRARALRYRKKVAKMMLVVVIVFAVCWFPIHAFHIKTEFGAASPSAVATVIKTIAHCLAYMNSALNPLIYAFMNRNFRQSFKAAFTCKKIKFHMIFLIQELEAIHVPNKKTCDSRGEQPQEHNVNKNGSGSSSGTSDPSPLMSTDLNFNSNQEVSTCPKAGVANTEPPAPKMIAQMEQNTQQRKVFKCIVGNTRECAERSDLELIEITPGTEIPRIRPLQVSWSPDGTVKSQVQVHKETGDT